LLGQWAWDWRDHNIQDRLSPLESYKHERRPGPRVVYGMKHLLLLAILPGQSDRRVAYLTSPECVLNLPRSSSRIPGWSSTLQSGMRTAACFSFGSTATGESRWSLASAARIAVRDFLVKGEENAAVRFGRGSTPDAVLVDVVVSVRSIISQTPSEPHMRSFIIHVLPLISLVPSYA
jgi:hypothetical protein